MKICDRCKKQTDTLIAFNVVTKAWSDGKPIAQSEADVCVECYPEGQDVLNSLARQLDSAQRIIMLEARDEWLATPVPLAEPQLAWARNCVTNEAGHSWIKAFKARFLAMFKKEEIGE